MAMVFRGENVLDPSIVRAIKVVFPQLSSQPEFVRRFSLEASVLDRLQHQNIVRFHGLRQARVEGSELLVMELELLDGKSLSEIVRPNLPIAQVVDLVRQASEGVAAAHALGVVHRDIKPHNLFLTRVGQVKVLDFGIARVVNDVQRADRFTKPGMIPGTAEYMAPEVTHGAVPTPLADVYALGIVLYELLLGRHPFADPGGVRPGGMEMMIAHAQRELPRMRATRADVSDSLERVLIKATAKDPTRRFPNANSLATALRGLQTTMYAQPSGQPMIERTGAVQPAPTNFQLPPLSPGSSCLAGVPASPTAFNLPPAPAGFSSVVQPAFPSATTTQPPNWPTSDNNSGRGTSSQPGLAIVLVIKVGVVFGLSALGSAAAFVIHKGYYRSDRDTQATLTPQYPSPPSPPADPALAVQPPIQTSVHVSPPPPRHPAHILPCSCSGRVCGDNGCGSSCGPCASPFICGNGRCDVDPNSQWELIVLDASIPVGSSSFSSTWAALAIGLANRSGDNTTPQTVDANGYVRWSQSIGVFSADLLARSARLAIVASTTELLGGSEEQHSFTGTFSATREGFQSGNMVGNTQGFAVRFQLRHR